MPTIGLTGNLGMGKTTVLRLFHSLGAYIFSCDEYVHQILERPEIIKKISTLLGTSVLYEKAKKPSLNKKRIASQVFDDPDKRKKIERIIHPEVLKAIKSDRERILKLDRSAVMVFEVPLLFETDFARYFDKTAVVFCSLKTAMKRAVAKGFSMDDAKKRLRAQMPITTKMKLADYRIENNGDMRKLNNRVQRIYRSIE